MRLRLEDVTAVSVSMICHHTVSDPCQAVLSHASVLAFHQLLRIGCPLFPCNRKFIRDSLGVGAGFYAQLLIESSEAEVAMTISEPRCN